VTITNDGVTILKEIEIEHPTAKMLVEVAKTQDDEVGTARRVRSSRGRAAQGSGILDRAGSPPDDHRERISHGGRGGVRRLRQLAFDVKRTDKTTLGSIARTAMSGRSVGTNSDFLADIAVEAVQSIVEEVAESSARTSTTSWSRRSTEGTSRTRR